MNWSFGVEFGIACAAASVALAAEPPPDADALRGPKIEMKAAGAAKSIVERDFNGRVKKLEEPPALAAVRVLELTPEDRAAADKVVGDRAAALDTIVRDNLRLIIELSLAQQAKDKVDSGRLLAEAMKKAGPYLKRGPLLQELRPVLPPEKFAALTRMVDEYRTAAAEDRMSNPMEGEKNPGKLGAMLAVGFEGFGQEVRASYQRVVEDGGKEFEGFIKMLDLSPQQESRVRRIAMDMFTKTYGKPTQMQKVRFMLDIYAELDTEQRHRLAEYLGEEGRAARASAAKSAAGASGVSSPAMTTR